MATALAYQHFGIDPAAAGRPQQPLF